MQGTHGQNRVLRCARCGAENYPFAVFCISCGEPFDDAAANSSEPDALVATPAGSEQSVIFSPSTPFSAYSPETSAPHVGAAPLPAQVPVSTVGRLHRRETVLGVALVVVALSLAIFNWQRDTAQSAAYRQGLAAEQARDWDKAATFFEQAGDHPDADGKARNARLQVAERNRLYVDGVAAAGRSDWKGAADAMATVEAIQPDFADSASRLVQARSRAFKLEMGGMVYLVSSGTAAGLYVLDKDGNPSRLPGSDGQSSVRASSPDGTRFVYDRPKSYTDFPISRPGKGLIPGTFSDASVSRIPVLATMSGGTATTYPLSALNGDGHGIFAQNGLWWYSGWYSEPWNTGYYQDEVYYTDAKADTSNLVRVSNPFSKERVLALDPARSRLVLGVAEGLPRSSSRLTQVYMAGPDGSNPRLLQTLQGDVQAASVSRDGRWLVVTAEYLPGYNQTERSVWLMPTEEGEARQPRKLETINWGGVEMPVRLSAAFLPIEQGPAMVLVDKATREIERLTFYSTEDGAVTHMWYSLTDQAHPEDQAGFSRGAAFIALRRQYAEAGKLEVVDLARPDFLLSWNVPLPSTPAQVVDVSFAPGDARVVVTVSSPDRNTSVQHYDIYTAKVEQKEGVSDLTRLTEQGAQSQGGLPATAISPGGMLLAYVNAKHELRAVFLDGKVDTIVADNIRAVWSLGQPHDLAWQR